MTKTLRTFLAAKPDLVHSDRKRTKIDDFNAKALSGRVWERVPADTRDPPETA